MQDSREILARAIDKAKSGKEHRIYWAAAAAFQWLRHLQLNHNRRMIE
jgi:hypothetical protein